MLLQFSIFSLRLRNKLETFDRTEFAYVMMELSSGIISFITLWMIELSLSAGLGNTREFNESPLFKPNHPNNIPLLPRPFRTTLLLLLSKLVLRFLLSRRPTWHDWHEHDGVGRTAGTTAEFPHEHRSPTGLNCWRFCGDDEHEHSFSWTGLGLKRRNCRGRGTRVDEQEQTSSPSAPQRHWAATYNSKILLVNNVDW